MILSIAGASTPIRGLSLRSLLPETEQFMTYEGSTTQPGCWETTVWIILNKPIYITKQEVRNQIANRVGVGLFFDLYGKMPRHTCRIVMLYTHRASPINSISNVRIDAGIIPDRRETTRRATFTSLSSYSCRRNTGFKSTSVIKQLVIYVREKFRFSVLRVDEQLHYTLIFTVFFSIFGIANK